MFIILSVLEVTQRVPPTCIINTSRTRAVRSGWFQQEVKHQDDKSHGHAASHPQSTVGVAGESAGRHLHIVSTKKNHCFEKINHDFSKQKKKNKKRGDV
jgi:hypothetical protein